MEKQLENMMIMGTIFGKKKKEPFSMAFAILKHPVYGFLTIFFDIEK